MKEKIIKILLADLNALSSNNEPAIIQGIPKAADEIIKEMDKACCEKCKYLKESWPDRCEYHHIDLSDTEILKCNDFTEMEGK